MIRHNLGGLESGTPVCRCCLYLGECLKQLSSHRKYSGLERFAGAKEAAPFMQISRLRRRSWGVIGGCLVATLVWAQSLVVIDLKYRRAEEIIPVLQPLLEQGGRAQRAGLQTVRPQRQPGADPLGARPVG